MVSDLRVVAIPGSSSAPPGETFGVNDYRTHEASYDRIEVDGHGTGASGFGSNISTGVTVRRSYFHDNPFSMGATFWQDRDVSLTDVIAVRNKAAGLNFERVSGRVTITRSITRHNGCCDLRIVSDRGSARYRIVDPVFDGPKLVVAWPRTYLGHPNLQRRSDVRLFVRGVDRTKDLLRFSVR